MATISLFLRSLLTLAALAVAIIAWFLAIPYILDAAGDESAAAFVLAYGVILLAVPGIVRLASDAFDGICTAIDRRETKRRVF